MLQLQYSDLRELDRREGDGIEVRLLWSEPQNRTFVTVHDRRAGREFTIEVNDNEHPLDVFHHPYAYARWHGTIVDDDDPELTARAA